MVCAMQVKMNNVEHLSRQKVNTEISLVIVTEAAPKADSVPGASAAHPERSAQEERGAVLEPVSF